jgi:Ca2+-binding EF-hand superfamily protein
MFSLAPGERARRERANVTSVVADLSERREEVAYLKILFEEVDTDHDGRISAEEFVTLYNGVKNTRKEKKHVLELFNQIDVREEGAIGFDDFLKVARMAEVEVSVCVTQRCSRG